MVKIYIRLSCYLKCCLDCSPYYDIPLTLHTIFNCKSLIILDYANVYLPTGKLLLLHADFKPHISLSSSEHILQCGNLTPGLMYCPLLWAWINVHWQYFEYSPELPSFCCLPPLWERHEVHTWTCQKCGALLEGTSHPLHKHDLRTWATCQYSSWYTQS